MVFMQNGGKLSQNYLGESFISRATDIFYPKSASLIQLLPYS